jgi:phage terminase large subunit-like protein
VTPKELREQTLALARADVEVRRRIIAKMIWQDVLKMDAEYERWVDQGQLEPSGDGWRTWLMMAGRGFGKTRAGAEWVFGLANSRPGVRIALIGATIGDARSIMVEGVSGLLSVAQARRRKVNWEPALGRVTWPNGSEAKLFSGDNADGLRGPEHDFAWVPPGA